MHEQVTRFFFRRCPAALLSSLVASFFAVNLSAENLNEKLLALTPKHVRNSVSVSVVDLESGHVLADLNSDTALTPASVQKLLISDVALRKLGKDFLFHTQFFTEGTSAREINTLWVKGGGDPTFVIENLAKVVAAIKAKGFSRIGKIAIDDTLYAEQHTRHGIRAYESMPTALTFNFNSLKFVICGAGKTPTVTAEPNELKIPIINELAYGKAAQINIDEQRSKNGRRYVVHGKVLRGGECIEKYSSVEDPKDHFARVFAVLLEEAGISVGDGYRPGVVPKGANLFYTHDSRPLFNIIFDMNHFSTNLIAESLVYRLGTHDGKSVYARGLDALRSGADSAGCKHEEYNIEDGSGLSRENRISSRCLASIFYNGLRSSRTGDALLDSLSTSSESGTLKSRNFGLKTGAVKGKTGTLDYVSSLAGVTKSKNGKEILFAIIDNGFHDKGAAVKFEDEVVRTLVGSL